MNQYLYTDITYLKGVGSKRAELLKKEIAVYNFYDLLHYYPYRYIDKSKFYKINELQNNINSYVQVKGVVCDMQIVGKNRAKRLVATLQDDTGFLDLVWFNGINYIEKSIQKNKEYIVFGKPTLFARAFNLSHPEISEVDKVEESQTIPIPFQPFYITTEKMKRSGLDSKNISKLIYQILSSSQINIEENLPLYLIEKIKLIDRKHAFFNIHFPQSQKLLKHAQQRLKFEELFFLQLHLLQSKQLNTIKNKGHVLKKVGKNFNDFYANNLPFELTNAQKKVIKEIRSDFISGKQMNRLLQGDVGSGKTITSLLVMLIVIDNGYQCCMMAPTEILANQHYESISKLLKNMDIEVELLTGSTKTKQRRQLLLDLKEGKTSILIGTHALIEKEVIFSQLGLVIIDEQHRFGVEQRAKLWKKNESPPHVLVMTATPIPRTLAMTVYGDLDVSVIDELPVGRKPVSTYHYSQRNRNKLIDFLKKQIHIGRQIFVVFPLIEESETLDLNNLMEGYQNFLLDFPPPHYHIDFLHGKLSTEEKDDKMQKFISGETHILLATTVIEVGVDIPNASVMLIENAERFGLTQLHQLRGRVGRGGEQSFCILLTGNKLSNEGKKRIQAMLETNDGFEIANFDLKLRGPGDLAGTKQSGMLEFKLVDIIKDEKLIAFSRNLATEILNTDPQLKNKEHICLNKYLNYLYRKTGNYYQIS